jgi:hypothetical protein
MPESRRRTSRSERSAAPASNADFWRSLHREFQELAQEEYTAVPNPASDRRFYAYGQYKSAGGHGCGIWKVSEGWNENFRSRFEDAALRGGIALGPPRGVKPFAYWFHRLFLYLLRSRRSDRGSLIAGRRNQAGAIRDVCETSSTYCLRLALQAPQTPRDESVRNPKRREERSLAIETALREIAKMRPKSHREVFEFLEQRAPLPRAAPFRTAKTWVTGFQRDAPRAHSWLSKVWRQLGLPPFPRGPK